jgi:hypothetical protein
MYINYCFRFVNFEKPLWFYGKQIIEINLGFLLSVTSVLNIFRFNNNNNNNNDKSV